VKQHSCKSHLRPPNAATLRLTMPPTRTFPPVKAVKTERTHEENQERFGRPIVCPRGDALTGVAEHMLLRPEEAIVVSKRE
jgi:hypothetical protein